jgi:hypothetical protein
MSIGGRQTLSQKQVGRRWMGTGSLLLGGEKWEGCWGPEAEVGHLESTRAHMEEPCSWLWHPSLFLPC